MNKYQYKVQGVDYDVEIVVSMVMMLLLKTEL